MTTLGHAGPPVKLCGACGTPCVPFELSSRPPWEQALLRAVSNRDHWSACPKCCPEVLATP